MRVHNHRAGDYDAQREREWNWWRPTGVANRRMGGCPVHHSVCNGELNSPQAKLEAMRERRRALYA